MNKYMHVSTPTEGPYLSVLGDVYPINHGLTYLHILVATKRREVTMQKMEHLPVSVGRGQGRAG